MFSTDILDRISEQEKYILLAESGKIREAGVMEALGLSPKLLMLPASSGDVVSRIITPSITRARMTLAAKIAKEIGLLGYKAMTRGAEGVFRLVYVMKHFPNFSAGIKLVKDTLETEKMLVLDPSMKGGLELELLQIMFPGKVRVALTNLPKAEEPNCTMPETWLTMGPVTQAEVMRMVRTLGGSITESGSDFSIWGIQVKVHEFGYTVNRRAEVRSSLLLTKYGAQMVDCNQAMMLLLTAADAGLTRRIASGGTSKNMYDKICQGWFMVAMASMLRFDGTYFVDGIRSLIEKGLFQPMAFGMGVYGPEVDTKLKLRPAEMTALIVKAHPETIAKPQGEGYLEAGVVVDLIRTEQDLRDFDADTMLDAEEFDALCTRLGDGELLAAVASTCPTKWLKRCLLDKVAACDTVNKDVSPVTFRKQQSIGPATWLLVAPTLLPIFNGGLGAATSLISRGEMAELLSFRKPATMSGQSAGIKTEEDLAKVLASLPEVGNHISKGDLINVHGMPVGIRVRKGKAGLVVAVKALPGAYHTATWEIVIQDDECRAEAKIRGLMKSTINFASSVFMSPTLTNSLLSVDGTEIIRHQQLSVFGAMRAQILLGMDAIKMTGKGSSEFIVRLAALTLKTLWGADWGSKVRELVNAKLIHEINGEVFVDYMPVADYCHAYDKLISTFEDVACKKIEIALRVTKQDWLELADHYEADLEDMDESIGFDGTVYQSVGVEIGTGMGGDPDELLFVEFPGANGAESKYYVVQCTTAFEGIDVVKVESTPISKSVSVVGSMLEVAYAAKATGQLDKFADWMELAGQTRANKLEHMLQMLTVRSDKTGASISISGTIRVPVTIAAKRVITLTQAAVSELIKDKALIDDIKTNFLAKEVDDWDPDTLITVEDRNGHWIAFDRAVLNDFGRGTDEGGMLQTVRNLLGYACEGNLQATSGMAVRLRMIMSRMTEGQNLFKWLHRGADGVYSKRTAVFATCEADNHKLFIHPRGQVARFLAMLFGCKPSELRGKKVAYYRGPQFLIIGLTIEFTTLVGRDEQGVTARVASEDNGDFDGDGTVAIPLTDDEVAAEVMAFDTYAYTAQVHAIGTTAATHWIEGNTFDSSKAAWSRPSIVSMTDIHELGIMSNTHQCQDMPSDSNRAHLRLVQASMMLGDLTCSIQDAQAMMFYVYETQLAGASWAWRKLHAILEDVSLTDPKAAFVAFATDPANKLNLTEHLAGVLYDSVGAHGEYASVDKPASKLVKFEGETMMVSNFVRIGAPVGERLEMPLNLLAGAVKRLSQGMCNATTFSRLLKNLPNMKVKSIVRSVDENDKVVYTDFINERGNAEVFSMSLIISQGAAKGNPACKRLVYFMDRILPLMEVITARAESEDDFDPEAYSVEEGSEGGELEYDDAVED